MNIYESLCNRKQFLVNNLQHFSEVHFSEIQKIIQENTNVQILNTHPYNKIMPLYINYLELQIIDAQIIKINSLL
jgi:hypothetical protein